MEYHCVVKITSAFVPQITHFKLTVGKTKRNKEKRRKKKYWQEPKKKIHSKYAQCYETIAIAYTNDILHRDRSTSKIIRKLNKAVCTLNSQLVTKFILTLYKYIVQLCTAVPYEVLKLDDSGASSSDRQVSNKYNDIHRKLFEKKTKKKAYFGRCNSASLAQNSNQTHLLVSRIRNEFQPN